MSRRSRYLSGMPPSVFRPIAFVFAAALALPVSAALTVVPGPDPGTRRFGTGIVVLPGGNYLVTDPDWAPNFGSPQAGAVYLYRADGLLLSRLAGSAAGDRVGSGGIVLLSDGNFVVRSPAWRASPVTAEAGAVTWGDADTGFGANAQITPANSLIGSSAGDRVGGSQVLALTDGNYVVASSEWDRAGVGADAGAVTWCAAGGGTVGPITPANSLVGGHADDRVGGLTVVSSPAVVMLTSGHYVVASDRWDNGAQADVGAVTWAHRDGSTVGEVDAARSLVGASAGDFAGETVQALPGGHYIVQSPYFDHGGVGNVGAVTWVDGSAPTAAVIGAGNSLLGSHDFDLVGLYAAVLENGHYVVASPLWDDDAVTDAGAVTWRDGSGPHPGVVGPGNSRIGSSNGDSIGYFDTIGLPPLGVVPLANSHYVIASPGWDAGAIVDAGAATWANGSGPATGPLTAADSLVGTHLGDAIAQYVLTLDDGHYVVGSPFWFQGRGAATWGHRDGGLAGAVDAANSLVGSVPEDFVSSTGIYRLQGGDYAVASSFWSLGETLYVGAVTRASGSSGLAGPVSGANSVIGSEAGDRVGLGGVDALPDGGYLVRSALASGLGAISRIGSPAAADDGIVTAANSLVGNSMDDRLGAPGATVLAGGAIVVHSANVAAGNAGAITLLDAADPLVGVRSEEVTVRSGAADGGPALTHAWLAASGTLLVGDPAANRIVRIQGNLIFRDGYESTD
jgi:hypothetical protein